MSGDRERSITFDTPVTVPKGQCMATIGNPSDLFGNPGMAQRPARPARI
jgi:hypothetical protein